MPMKNPPHSGLSVRLNCLDPFSLSVTEGAKVLGVSRTTLSRLINGRARVSPIWPSASQRPSAPRPIFGFGCRQPTIWSKSVGMKGRFISGDTSRGRRCERLSAYIGRPQKEFFRGCHVRLADLSPISPVT